METSKDEIYEKVMSSGIQEQGIEQGVIKIAKRMIELNMPIEKIRDITGLTDEEIEKIK